MKLAVKLLFGLLLLTSFSLSLSADKDWDSCGDDKANSKQIDMPTMLISDSFTY